MCEQLSQAAASYQILKSQGLMDRFADSRDAMRAVVAVQTQYPASLGPALAARANNVTAAEIEKAVSVDRLYLKAWNLRSTLHTMFADDHMLLLCAMQEQLLGGFIRWMGAHGTGVDQLQVLHKEILEALANGPLGRKELHEKVPYYKGLPMVGWGLDGMGLAFEGKLVLANQAAANTRFVRLDLWSPSLEPCSLSPEDALKSVIRRYFKSYGPATYQDFLYWTGLRASRVHKVFEEINAGLKAVTVEGKKGVHFVIGDIEADADTAKSPVRLLPKFDPLPMGHKDKSLFLPDGLKPMVFRKAGQVEATLLYDGQIRGTWRTVRKGARIEFVVEPFSKLRRGVERAIEKEAQLAALSLGFEKSGVLIKQ